jgi:hypothetical protein
MGKMRVYKQPIVFPKPRLGLIDQVEAHGQVYWELVDSVTGKVTKRGEGFGERAYWRFIPERLRKWIPLGKQNGITNYAREEFAKLLTGESVTAPTFIGVGTGTNTVAAADSELQTVSQYDSSNDAKVASSRSLKGPYTARIITQFDTDEANVTIKELGLFETNEADDPNAKMWARVNVTITKVSTERLNIHWYITFERREGLAIKSGASIATSGDILEASTSTLTFASPVTIFTIHNNSGEVMYVKLNEALSGSPPTNYDFMIEDSDTIFQSDEEIEVSTIHVFKATAVSMPTTTVSVRGW